MSAAAQLAPVPTAPPEDPDALYAALTARAVALPGGSISGADALLADIVGSSLSAATFKPLVAAIAKATGLDAGELLKQASKAREVAEPRNGKGGASPPSGMQNPDPAPNPEPLDKVLEQMARAIRRQVVCSAHAVDAVVLWAAGSYGFQGASIYPRLAITSATKQCGKSTLLASLRTLVSRPLKADNVSASAVFRVVGEHAPTLLIDEVDAFFSKGDELRGVINAGYERSGAVMRSVPTPDGKSFTLGAFNVYCPVALAGIGGLPDTVLDRSIVIRLDRAPTRATAQRQAPMRHRELEALRGLVAPHLVAHAVSIEAVMAKGLKQMPRGLSDRAQDNWEPLIALADLAGGDWPFRARAAATVLSGGKGALSQRELLLADLKPLVDAERAAAAATWLEWMRGGRAGWVAWVQGGQQGGSPAPQRARYVRSVEALRHLLEMEDRPWPEYGRDNKGLTPHRLADMLRPFGIAPVKQRMPARHPHPLRPTDTESVRAYPIAALRGAFLRYLPREP